MGLISEYEKLNVRRDEPERRNRILPDPLNQSTKESDSALVRPDGEAQRIRDVYQTYAESDYKRRSWSADNPGNQLIRAGLQAAICDGLERYGLMPLTGKRLIEVGCGAGDNLALFQAVGALPNDLYGIDIIASRVQKAQALHPDMRITLADARSIPFPDRYFELAAASVLFSSVLDDAVSHAIAGEITRVLKRGGALVWYDLRRGNPFNSNVRGISRSSVQRLFPEFDLHLQPLTLLPQLARCLKGQFVRLYQPLSQVPFMRTHYVGILVKH